MHQSTLRVFDPQHSPVVAVHDPAEPNDKPRKRRKKGDKPEKPYPDFPLFPHATKRWAKKIRGQLHYFGSWADGPEAALEKYLDQKDDLHAGRTPRAKVEGLSLEHLCNHFLHAKKKLLDAGELAQRTWNDYETTCKAMLAFFGRTRLVIDLSPDDLAAYRAEMAKTWGPVTLGNEIIRVRVVLKHAADCKLIPAPVHMGSAFKKPSAKTVRKARAEKGPRMFEPAELRRVIAAAKLPLKSWALLGVNCGYGNADCARLPLAALDLDRGWVAYHREKTGIPRRAKLWPETCQALREWLDQRPQPAKDAGELVFVDDSGESLYDADRGTAVAIGRAMQRLLEKLKVGGNRNFYALRHTFETIGGEARDQAAVDHVMGHIRNDMASVYRERISDDRLEAVAGVVRAWLYSGDHDEHVAAWRARLSVRIQ